MAQELLNGANVVAGLQEMGGEGVAQAVRGGAFLNTRLLGSLLDGSLQTGGVHVMAAFLPTAGVNGASGSRKERLPDELTGGVGVLAFQRIGPIDLSVAGGQVLLMEQADPFYLAAQFWDDRVGLFGAVGVMLESENVAEPVQKFLGHCWAPLQGGGVSSKLCCLEDV